MFLKDDFIYLELAKVFILSNIFVIINPLVCGVLASIND